MVDAFARGVEEYCQCGLSTRAVHNIFLQCFPDDLNKMNVILIVQAIPSKNISEIILYTREWIGSSSPITIASNPLQIDMNCDIETVQGPDCNVTKAPPSILSATSTIQRDGTSTPFSDGNVPKPTAETNTYTPCKYSGSQSQNNGLAVAGGFLFAVAMLIMGVFAVVVVIMVLVKFKIVKWRSFNL